MNLNLKSGLVQSPFRKPETYMPILIFIRPEFNCALQLIIHLYFTNFPITRLEFHSNKIHMNVVTFYPSRQGNQFGCREIK
jgi:hypothetical protein